MCIRNEQLWSLYRNAVGNIECCPDNHFQLLPHHGSSFTKGAGHAFFVCTSCLAVVVHCLALLIALI